jgi:CheY-like chemotaxis protein
MEKILIVEDTEKHLASAKILREQGFEVETVGDLRSAVERIFGDATYGYAGDAKSTTQYHALLTDFFIPSGGYGAYRKDPRTPEPLGLTLALAGVRAKIPYIGVVSDTSHHSGNVSSGLDLLIGKDNLIQMDESRVVVLGCYDLKPMYLLESGSAAMRPKGEDNTGYQLGDDGGRIYVKNWPEAYQILSANDGGK